MSEWKEYKLGEVLTFQRGYDLPKGDMMDGPYPVAGSNGIIGYHAKYTTKGPGITIGRSGNIGMAHYYPIDFWAHNTTLYVKDFKGNEPKFIYYLLKTIDFSLFNTGSAVPSLNRNHVHELVVSIPPLDEQKRIAGVLSSLDDKIDLLHRENATLEAIAETLFRHYFIENPNPTWKEGTIDDVIEINPARRLSKGENAPYLEMANINTQGCAPLNWYNRPFSSGSKYINGDALMARITPCLENGKAAYIDFLGNGQVGWGSTEFIVLRTRIGLHPFFAYVLTRYSDFRDHAISSLVGSSGRQRVDIDNLRKYSISIPDEKTIKIFNHDMDNVVPKIKNNNHEILTLIQIRDGLLPKLMSNEITL